MQELVLAGLILAGFGIESMNDDVLKSMKKHITKNEIINALEICRQLRLECVGNIILGDTAESVETVRESISWWKANSFYQGHIGLGFIRAVPDSPLYQYALEKGLINNKLDHAKNLPLVNMSNMSDKEYYKLVLQVCWWNIMLTYMTSGTLIRTCRLHERHRDKHFYELHLRCPFCGKEQTQKKCIGRPAPNIMVNCSHCFAYFKIKQKIAFPNDYSLIATYKEMLIRLGDAYSMRFRFISNNKHLIKKMLQPFMRWFR